MSNVVFVLRFLLHFQILVFLQGWALHLELRRFFWFSPPIGRVKANTNGLRYILVVLASSVGMFRNIGVGLLVIILSSFLSFLLLILEAGPSFECDSDAVFRALTQFFTSGAGESEIMLTVGCNFFFSYYYYFLGLISTVREKYPSIIFLLN